MTNNEFYKRIYKPYQEAHMSKNTCIARCGIIEKRLLELHGEETLNSVSFRVIEGIYDEMEAESLKQNTIFGTYAALSSYFRMAVDHNEIVNNPVKFARTIRASIQIEDEVICSNKELTLNEWVYSEDYTNLVRASESTQRMRTGVFEKHLRKPIGDKKLSEITPEDIQSIYIRLYESGKTIIRVYTTISSFLTTAMKAGLITNNPCSRVARVYPFQIKPEVIRCL